MGKKNRAAVADVESAKTVVMVAGVRLDMVDEEVLNAALKERGLELKQPLGARVASLAAWFSANYDDDDIINCDKCGGDSSDDEPRCTFCGDESEVVDPTAERIAATKARREKEERVAPPEPTKKKAKKKGKEEKALAKAGPESKFTESDLNEAVKRIRTAAVENMYDMGLVVRDIHETQKWKLRLRDGKPAYRSFNQFCAEELPFSKTHAHTLMKVTEAFTRDVAVEIGVTKLGLVLKAPEENQPELMQAAMKDGVTERALEARVAELRGRTTRETPESTPPEKRTITIAVKPGSKTTPLFKKGSKGESPKAAKRIADQPWTMVQLENNTRLFVRIATNSSGELVLKHEFRRGE